jgi:NAD(P)-dependent dehydrogenase (short-subunit alcohol dehydrogenase family)
MQQRAASGWGRIVNVTTKLGTMHMLGAMRYGASKAALEMATEVRARELSGNAARLVEPEGMVPPLLSVVSPTADAVNGYRFGTDTLGAAHPSAEAAPANSRPAGFILRPQEQNCWPSGG